MTLTVKTKEWEREGRKGRKISQCLSSGASQDCRVPGNPALWKLGGGSMQSMHDAPMQSETSRSCAPCSLNTRELFMITLSDSCCDNSLPISQQNLKHVCTVLHDMHEPHAVPQNPRTGLPVVFIGCPLTVSTVTLPQTLYL